MITETMLDPEKIKARNEDQFDIIIIGAGPAGMSAAVCAGRADLKILLIEQALPGGETSTAYKIENLLGYPDGILGDELAANMERHVSKYNISYSCETVEDISDARNNIRAVKTDLGHTYYTKAIIIATGLEPKKLDTKFEQKFMGRGLSYYAQSDVDDYKDSVVAVIGDGNCACYAAEYLSEFVSELYLIHKSDTVKAVISLKQKLLNNPKIKPMWNSEVTDIFGIDKVEKIKVENTLTNQHTWLDVKGVFVYVGRIPSSQLFNLELENDEKGYIITDEYMRTNLPGIYAAGDIRSKQIRQIATAINDGMIAAINAERDMLRQ